MQEIALCDLKPTKNNVRKTKGADVNMDRLVASIKHNGLLKNLVVKKNGKGYFVTDGNRRLQALVNIHGKNSSEIVECKVIDENANETEVGLHANMMHENMHPMDECEAINKICEEGLGDYDSIASQFGRTERWVRQRVKLADLSPLAKEKFRAMEFGIAVAEALTMGDWKTQDAFFEEYGRHYNYNADDVYSYIVNNKIPVAKAIFDITGHENDLGIVKDLFAEDDEAWITNVDKFKELTQIHIDNLIEERKKKSFKDVIYLYDETIYDSNQTNHLERPVKRAKDKDTTLVIQYMPWKGELSEIRMVNLPIEDVKPSGLVDADGENIETPSDSPYEFSNPQSFMLRQYRNEFLRSHMYDHMKDFDFVKFGMASIAAKTLHGFDYSYENPGNGWFENHSTFNHKCEVTKDDYTPIIEQELTSVVSKANIVCESDGISPFEYYYNLNSDKLNRIFGILSIRSCDASDFQSKEFQTIYKPKIDETKWFRPFENWLAKYSREKLVNLYNVLTNKNLSADIKKKDAIKEVKGALDHQGSNGFNPFQTEPFK